MLRKKDGSTRQKPSNSARKDQPEGNPYKRSKRFGSRKKFKLFAKGNTRRGCEKSRKGGKPKKSSYKKEGRKPPVGKEDRPCRTGETGNLKKKNKKIRRRVSWSQTGGEGGGGSRSKKNKKKGVSRRGKETCPRPGKKTSGFLKSCLKKRGGEPMKGGKKQKRSTIELTTMGCFVIGA